MWCPTCRSEYRDEIVRCASCGVDLVPEEPGSPYPMHRGPLTGRPIEEELQATGPAVAGNFVTYEEAQAALRALSDAGVDGEATSREEVFPNTIARFEPAFSVTVAGADMPKAREVLASAGLLPTAIARFRREEDAHAALTALEAQSIHARISTLVLDEIPAEFRDDMEAYSIEVPAEMEGRAYEILAAHGFRACEACGAQVQPDDGACRSCGETVAV